MNHPQPESVETTFYAVITPIWRRYGTDESGRPILDGAHVDRITKNRPATIKGDAIVTRLTLRIEAAALLPMQPQAVVHIRAGDTEIVTVEASNPSEAKQ